MKIGQFYKEKSLIMLKRSQNFRLRRAKQATDREILYLKILSAKIIHMAKSRKKTLMLSIPSRGEPDTKDSRNERIRTGQTISEFFIL